MADKTIREAFGDIADAIRAKGITGTMTPLQMPTKIGEIETGGGSSGYTVHINSVESTSENDDSSFRLYFDDDRLQSYMVYITSGYNSNYCGLKQKWGQSREVLVNTDSSGKTLDYVWYNVKAIKFYGTWGGEINGVHYDEDEVVTLTEDSNIGGHHYTCLKWGTLITMADGSTKKVEELELGDVVRSINPDTNQVETDVVTYVDGAGNHSAYGWDEWKFDDGTTLSTVNPHRFFNVEKQKMVYLHDWNIDEHARKEDGTEVKLVEHIRHTEFANHSTLFTQKWNNYFANGLLSGNRRSTKWGDGQ